MTEQTSAVYTLHWGREAAAVVWISKAILCLLIKAHQGQPTGDRLHKQPRDLKRIGLRGAECLDIPKPFPHSTERTLGPASTVRTPPQKRLTRVSWSQIESSCFNNIIPEIIKL